MYIVKLSECDVLQRQTPKLAKSQTFVQGLSEEVLIYLLGDFLLALKVPINLLAVLKIELHKGLRVELDTIELNYSGFGCESLENLLLLRG